jgi:SAM-dependent methyltransferase
MQYPKDFSKKHDSKIWLSNQEGFELTYSDGLEEEIYIENCLQQASDLSSSSTELASCISNWSSEYHLSPKRSTLLRPLKLEPSQSVLELGAGCGAITRYLGETVSQVIAVEGSRKRAEIAALRCRDLDNVQVVVANFQNLEFAEKFDIVTLIGVVEYSGLYLQSHNPYQQTLEIAKRYLKDDGILLLAIENKLGLKYFAGCSEDHTGVPFDGIEGYVRQQNVRTFGKKELENLLKSAGFESFQFLYPFPDYKLPNVVLRLDEQDEYQQHYNPFLYQWLGYKNSRDYYRQKLESFNEFLVAKQIETNGLLPQMSNSFLVLAGTSSETIDKYLYSDVIAYKCSVTRQKHYMTQVSLRKGSGDSLWVKREPLHPALVAVPQEINNDLKHYPSETTEFVQGVTLMELLIQSVMSNQLQVEQSLKCILKRWHEFLLQEAQRLTQSETDLPGLYIDSTPWNLIVNQNDAVIYVDREWNYGKNIPIKFIIFRGLIYIFQEIYPWIDNTLDGLIEDNSFAKFLEFCLNLLGLEIEAKEQAYFLKIEFDLQKETTYLASMDFDSYLKIINTPPTAYLISKKLDRLEAQLQTTKIQLQTTQEEVQHISIRWQHSQARIEAMESSKFWKLRQLWFRFKPKIGLSVDE